MDVNGLNKLESIHIGSPSLTAASLLEWEDLDSENLDIFEKVWKHAINQCYKDLNPQDRKRIKAIGSYREFAMDLQNLERSGPAGQSSFDLTVEVLPVLSTLNKVTTLFILAIQPRQVEVTFIWGVFHLLIELAIKKEEKWELVTETFQSTLRRLRICEAYVKDEPELSEPLLLPLADVFRYLILFWAKATKAVRLYSLDDVRAMLTKANAKMIKDIDESLNELERISARIQGPLGTQKMADIPKSGSSQAEFPCDNLPGRSTQKFLGRKTDLANLLSRLVNPPSPTSTSSEGCIIALHGLGGVGKSRLALATAEHSKDYFDARFWIRAESRPSLDANFAEISKLLGLSTSTTNVDDVRDFVHSQLRTCGKRWLLIFDNVTDISLVKPYMSLPRLRGSILFTTRSRREAYSYGPQNAWPVSKLARDESYDFFDAILSSSGELGLLDEQDKLATRHLLDALDGLPLAIRQMAALITSRTYSATSLYERFATSSLPGQSIPLDDHDSSIETLWETSFRNLRETAPNAFNLLGLMAFLSPDEIEAGLVEKLGVITDLPESLSFGKRRWAIEDARGKLLQQTLIDGDPKMANSVHRLVRRATRHHLTFEESNDLFRAAVAIVEHIFPKQVLGEPMFHNSLICSKNIEHVRRLADAFAESCEERQFKGCEKLCDLLRHATWYLYEIGDFEVSLKYVHIGYSLLDKESEQYTWFANTEASIHFGNNNLSKARSCYVEIYEVGRRVHGEESDFCCGVIGNIANTDLGLGDFAAAEKGYIESAKTRISLFGANNVVLTWLYLGLTRVYITLGQLESACEYLKKAETVAVNNGSVTEIMQFILFVKGNLELRERNFTLARDHFKEAYNLLLQLSPGHASLISILYKLGVAEMELENYDEAMCLFDKGLDIAQAHDSLGEKARLLYKASQILQRQAQVSTEDLESVDRRLQTDKGGAEETAGKLLRNARTLRREIEEKEKFPAEGTALLRGLVGEDALYDRLVPVFYR